MKKVKKQEIRQSHRAICAKPLGRAQIEDTERRPSAFLETYTLARLYLEILHADRPAGDDQLSKWRKQLQEPMIFPVHRAGRH